MADYDNKNSGVLFVNNDKKTEKSPDYSGTINIEGKDYKLVGWKRDSKNGKKFLSLVIDDFKPKAQQPVKEVELADVNLDELPF